MGIRVQKGGLCTTVQDYGRVGHQHLGFSVSGVMDRRAYQMANLLVNHQEEEAVLEFIMEGPTLHFTTTATIALTGGKFTPCLNGCPVPMYEALTVAAGSILSFQGTREGLYGYIAFANRLDIPPVLGSRSTNLKCGLGGFQGRRLTQGDYLDFLSEQPELPCLQGRRLPPPLLHERETILRVIPGPQEEWFTPEGVEIFYSGVYQVTHEMDRMACRLDGPPVAHRHRADIISDGIPYGAVQIPASGKPIIMLSDRQTTGGYAKIATVISTDIPRLVQKGPGQKIRFQPITIEAAHALCRQERVNLDSMKKSLPPPYREPFSQRASAKRIAALFKINKE